MRKFLISLVLLLILSATAMGWLVYSRFWRYQTSVDQIRRSLPRDERSMSREAANVIKTLEAQGMPWIVSRNILADVAPEPVPISEWQVRGMIWESLLPRRLSNEEITVLYAHYMQFEGGSGLAFGSQKYFGTSPRQLTADQAIQLCVIAHSPKRYSPSHHPEAFSSAVARYRAKYRTAG